MSKIRIEMVSGLDLRDVVARLASALRAHDVGNRALAFYLWEMADRRLSQQLGYPDAVSYARSELGIGTRRAQELVAAGRGLLELRDVDSAFRRGELCWSKVRMLLRVATVETEREWVERAKGVGCRELERLVRRARPGDVPGGSDGDGGLPELTFRLVVEMDALLFEEWTQAKRKLQAEMGTILRDEDVLRLWAQQQLATRVDGSVPGRVAVDDSIYRVIVEDGAPHVCTDDGPEVTSQEALEAARSDAAVPARLRRQVIARDRHRCTRCGRKGHLQVHHVVWRCRGGATSRQNLTTLCAHCHSLAHAGLLVVEVDEGTGLRFRPAHRHETPAATDRIEVAPESPSATNATGTTTTGDATGLDRISAQMAHAWLLSRLRGPGSPMSTRAPVQPRVRARRIAARGAGRKSGS